ncbi:restriction endonuclease subunit S [Phocaeicola plebeius]|jgi:type I restriction enzyme S subunit|uniref:restriction endonuclease subunit S n=1 Tax=Phocaeicola plebeius TaxID=310297 RepID=UPI0022E81EBA|nr:restriction endonuclease subunit S [Phocaeicola plebeius]
MKKIITIGELGSIITGNTPPRSNPELYGNYTPFIKATDISETEKYTYTPEEYYSEEGYNKYIKSLIPKGSTCVVTIGSIGKKMTMAHCDLFINQAMNAIVPNKNFDKEYVYYAVKNILPNIKMLDSGTASGRENVSKSAFSKMEILIEDNIVIQQRIAEILSRYDSLIENYQKQIKLLEEAAQRLYKEWFVDLRFPGYENTKIVDGVPEGWKKVFLTELIEPQYGKDHKSLSDGLIPLYGSGGIMRYVNKVLYSGESVLIPRKGSLNNIMLVSGSFWTIDTMFYSKPLLNYIMNLVYFYLKGKDLYMYNVGAAVPSMTVNILSKMDIILPDENIRKCFDDKLSLIFNNITNIASQIRILTEARDSLLPKLMRGEIEV